jgi:hypothetical protein
VVLTADGLRGHKVYKFQMSHWMRDDCTRKHKIYAIPESEFVHW